MEKLVKQSRKFAELWNVGYKIRWWRFQGQNRLFGMPSLIKAVFQSAEISV